MIQALRAALAIHRPDLARLAIEPLPDKGLAHQHLRLLGADVLARIPKQSQMGLHAVEHLAYEAACFERAAASGHTPRLYGVLPPSAELPRGGLLVQEIHGRPVQLPQDLDALVQALAAIHSLPLPDAPERAPLLDPFDPLAALLTEIEQQALHLDAALLAPQARQAIDRELLALRALCANAARPSKQLISFDAHPGNFLIDAHGRAILVDLEKARYGAAALDLAHATLYTSTTWDLAAHAELQRNEVVHAYESWIEQMAAGETLRPWLVPLRRAMFLWSITWCAKWRALATQRSITGGDGEDWSADLSDATLVAHVRERVNHYLSPTVVTMVCDDNRALEDELTLL